MSRSRTAEMSLEENEGASARPAKTRRIRLACQRCQRRKIRCDGGIPKCANCQRAGEECLDGKKVGNNGSISRIEAASLHEHIQKLESALRQHMPDIDVQRIYNTSSDDLSTGNPMSQPTAVRATSSPGSNPNRLQSPDEEEDFDNPTDVDGTSSPHLPPRSVAEVTHEIGLVPVSAGVNKYVGPSSGFAMSKLIFNRARQDHQHHDFGKNDVQIESPSTTTSRIVLAIEPTRLPTSIAQANQLASIYFEHCHIQYPFLHQPTFYRILNSIYSDPDSAPTWATFQVTMVLAISASILSKRLPIPFSGESLCATALRSLPEIDVQSSIQGLQCLLLVYMFTLHSPYSGVSPWHLNYQFLATILDLGLQRDVVAGSSFNVFEREMRARIFWVVYSIDRTLATTLGRPIGLRDEACDLRLPEGLDDCEMHDSSYDNVQMDFQTGRSNDSISCALTLFKLARLNSEIKYILHSLRHSAPKYTYPQITDIEAWQEDIWQRLQDCHRSAPKFADERRYLTLICSIRYHEVVMHLFRPTPRIRNPSAPSMQKCNISAEKTINLWKQLYEADRMSYSWVTIHSVCLSALTILYCIWMSPDITAATRIDVFTSTMRDASILLSAAGEYWSEARRSRSRLDGLVNATVRWLTDKLRANSGFQARQSRSAGSGENQRTRPSRTRQNDTVQSLTHPTSNFENLSYETGTTSSFDDHTLPELNLDTYINNEDLASFLGAPDAFVSDNNFLMEGMFSDYQPLFDFTGIDSGVNTGFFNTL